MADRREAIIRRILVVLNETNLFVTVARNSLHMPDEICPGVVVFDADEVVASDHPDAESWSPPRRPQFMTMRPDICLRLTSKTKDMGSELNRLRAAVYLAIVSDQALHDLIGSNGRMMLDAARTQLAAGRQMTADMTMSFSFTYPLLAKDLAIYGSASLDIDDVVVA